MIESGSAQTPSSGEKNASFSEKQSFRSVVVFVVLLYGPSFLAIGAEKGNVYRPFDLVLFQSPGASLDRLSLSEIDDSIRSLTKKLKANRNKEQKELISLVLARLKSMADSNVSCINVLKKVDGGLLEAYVILQRAHCQINLAEYYLGEKRRLAKVKYLLNDSLLKLDRLFLEYPEFPRRTELERLRFRASFSQAKAINETGPAEKAELAYLQILRFDDIPPETRNITTLRLFDLALKRKNFENAGRYLGYLRRLGLLKGEELGLLEKRAKDHGASALVWHDPEMVVAQEIKTISGIRTNIFIAQEYAGFKEKIGGYRKEKNYRLYCEAMAEGLKKYYHYDDFPSLIRDFDSIYLASLSTNPANAIQFKYFQKVIDKFDDKLLLELGKKLRAGGHTNLAKNIYGRALLKYPLSGLTDSILYDLGRMLEDVGELASSLGFFEALVVRLPYSSFFEHSLFKIGWLNYRLGRYREAIGFFDRYLSQVLFDQFQQSTLYWKAISHQKIGEQAEFRLFSERLIEYFPQSFYGLLARMNLNLSLAAIFPKGDDIAETARPSGLSTRESLALARGERLLAIGLTSFAEDEFDLVDLRGQGSSFLIYMAGLWERTKSYDKSLRTAMMTAESFFNSIPEFIAFRLYPTGYLDLVKKAIGNEIDPLWIIALIRQESMFRRDAVSSAKAYGLAQLLLSTARRISERTDLESTDLFDPETNIEIGAKYFKGLLKRFGRIHFAIGAYNAGEEAMAEWVKHFGGLEPAEFIESVPYRETRGYIKLVTRNFLYYSYLYNRRTFGSLGEIYGK